MKNLFIKSHHIKKLKRQAIDAKNIFSATCVTDDLCPKDQYIFLKKYHKSIRKNAKDLSKNGLNKFKPQFTTAKKQ